MWLDIPPLVPGHATEELLEEYAFGRIHEPELAELEEHLLVCPLCQSKLLAIDQYMALMKSGMSAFEQEPRAALSRKPTATSGNQPHFALRRIPGINVVLAAAFMLLFISSTMAWRMQPRTALTARATSVRLIAWRGGDGDGAARAPSGQPLDLVIDRTDLPAALSYRMEVIGASGHQIWSGAAQMAEQNLSARLASPLRPGMYWVRLYSAGGQLRREFGLYVE